MRVALTFYSALKSSNSCANLVDFLMFAVNYKLQTYKHLVGRLPRATTGGPRSVQRPFQPAEIDAQGGQRLPGVVQFARDAARSSRTVCRNWLMRYYLLLMALHTGCCSTQ